MYGWSRKILRVDLTKGECRDESIDPQVAKDYIGGRGLGIYYLNKEVDAQCDPLSPANIMVMATGPLTGTKTPTGGRYMVMTKSPLSGALTTSNAGGKFPTEMKKTGYDAFLISGRAERPVYLWVGENKTELVPAEHLWGKNTHETTDQLLSETDSRARVACIGPAGENQVLFAAILNDKHRAAGRSGVGAVMGSKNLKAIVVRGKQKVMVHDEARFNDIHKPIMDQTRNDLNAGLINIALYGTTYGPSAMNTVGSLPTKNFQYGTFEKWDGGIHEEFKEKYFVKKSACGSCPIGCGRVSKVEEPGFEGEGEGPEYETLFAMGSNCLIDNVAAITKANYLCNELGIDTISMGCTVACAMELVDRGYLSEDTVGRPLKWGDGEALVELVRKTGYREGFGDMLAEGSYRLADRFGHPELAMVVKKQDFAGYEPRSIQGMGLGYATSPIGGSHMRGDSAYYEIFGSPLKIDPFTIDDKPRLMIAWQDLSCIIDSAGLCIFYVMRYLVNKTLTAEPEPIMNYLNAVTGADYTLDELIEAGTRIFTAERKFLADAGFTKKDDLLPPRITQEPMPDGPAAGNVNLLEEMLAEYYALRGWTADGVPEKKTLEKYGLA
jgi:aldehyde:ferredoxin oxidoreductase